MIRNLRSLLFINLCDINVEKYILSIFVNFLREMGAISELILEV